MSRRRVVITGAGVVSPFGFGAEALWKGVHDGESALGPIGQFDASGFRSSLAAEVPEYDVRKHVPKSYRKAAKVMARDVEIAVIAADLAVQNAGITTIATDAEPTYPGERFGCSIGAGLLAANVDELGAAMVTASDEQNKLDQKRWGREGMQNLTPLWLLKTLPNMLACHVTIVHGAKGPSNTLTNAQASGLLSVGELARVIERGDADAGFAGSAESKVNPMGIVRMEFAGFTAACGNDDDPRSIVKPFDPGAEGGLLGEGGGLFVLEGFDAAEDRGARMLAEVVGFGSGQSLGGRWAEEMRGRGLARAVRAAIGDASLTPDDIDVIVPAGLGTPVTDREELAGLVQVFGERLGEIPCITHTPNVGDAVAGLGGLSVSLAVSALRSQRLPARLHPTAPSDPICAGRSDACDATLRTALVCAVGLGGQTAALVLRTLDRGV